jgi:hypothetical protein
MSTYKRILGALTAAVVMAAAVAQPVLAQSNPASGLRISPTRAEVTAEASSTAEAKFNIKNVTGGRVTMKAKLNDFDPQDDGSPKPLKENETNAASIRSFITLPGDVVLEPDEALDVVIPIIIPVGQAPGSYYGVVLFQGVPLVEGEAPGQVSLTGSVGGIVLVSVPGEVKESMQLVSVKAGRLTPGQTNEVRLSNVFAQPFDRVQVRVKNTGNSFLKPFGKVTVTDWRDKVVGSYEMNDTDPKANVLPNSQRVFTDTIKDIKTPGRYTVSAGIAYGQGGDVLTQQITVWYLPIWVVVVAVLVIAAAVFAVLRLLKKAPRK